MSTAPLNIDGVMRASDLLERESSDEQREAWSREALRGRLTELSSEGATASLTFAFDLLRRAQRAAEPCAWVTLRESAFFPPDAARNGIDLKALPVVRLPDVHAAGRAADRLVRSGGFGVVTLDLTAAGGSGRASRRDDLLPHPLQRRLHRHAERHEVAVVFLTEAPSLGSSVSLRARTHRKRGGGDRFECELEAVDDKRFGPGWTREEICGGPPGLR